MSSMNLNKLFFAFLVSLIGVFGAVIVGRVWPYTMDDSYITFRYARNLVQFGSIVWNHNETIPTEGFTSLIWVLVNSVFEFIGVTPVVGSKVIGFLCVFGTVFLVTKRIVSLRPNFGLFIFVLVSGAFFLNPDIYVLMVSGMETSLALFLTTLIFLLSLKLIEGVECRRSYIFWGLINFIAILNRPEFVLITTFLTCGIVYFAPKQSRVLFIKYSFSLLSFLGICYLAGRYTVYGLSLPLPFYIKVSSVRFAGFSEVLSFYKTNIILLVLIATGGMVLLKRKQVILALGILLIHSVFFMFPAHMMGIAHRFLMPIFGVFVFLTLESGLFAFEKIKFVRTYEKSLIFILLVFFGISFDIHTIDERIRDSHALESAHVKIGNVLSSIKEQDHLIALSDAGAIPY